MTDRVAYRADGRVERVCSCGVGHPDRELTRVPWQDWMGVHGCCGCCEDSATHLLGVLQSQGEPSDPPQEPLSNEVGATFEGECLPEGVGDLLYRLTDKSAGITRLADGRYAFVCGTHLLARFPVVQDPIDLRGMTCRVCEAEREAAGERLRFRELLHG